jgi:glutamate-5-semialdehyde dehydrogenase
VTDALNAISIAQKGRAALSPIGESGQDVRNQALLHLVGLIDKNRANILAGNQNDLENALADGVSSPILDRLRLTDERLNDLTYNISKVASLPDPLGEIEDFRTLENGLTVGRMRVPLGLILFICEARPGAVVEAAAMALKSGNPIIIKPGKEASLSSYILGDLISEALDLAGLPKAAVQVIGSIERDALKDFLVLSDYIDLVIPRGGEGLIRFVAENSRIPVLKHYKGVCHLYADEYASLDMAISLILDGKLSRCAACNALECLLVHKDIALELLKRLAPEFVKNNVSVRASEEALPFLIEVMGKKVSLAQQADWDKEYLDLILNVKIVDSFADALEHIQRHGSNHTEAIVTKDLERARQFLRSVDASCVMVNASTRLNDGGVLGLGAEIGISTSKLQAYGPMGLKELTTRKFVVLGEGHTRS